ncbi:MAG: 30S ribosomal protein S20 [Anaerovoracaceae bacterium]|jgi:small subunit ribosomal protein S20
MANIKSAKKRITVIENKTAQNKRIREHIKEVLKEYDAAIEAGNLEEAEQKLRLAEKKLKKAASKHVIHKNAASRQVSNLYKKLNKAKAE